MKDPAKFLRISLALRDLEELKTEAFQFPDKLDRALEYLKEEKIKHDPMKLSHSWQKEI